jgi:hypothetical protein
MTRCLAEGPARVGAARSPATNPQAVHPSPSVLCRCTATQAPKSPCVMVRDHTVGPGRCLEPDITGALLCTPGTLPTRPRGHSCRLRTRGSGPAQPGTNTSVASALATQPVRAGSGVSQHAGHRSALARRVARQPFPGHAPVHDQMVLCRTRGLAGAGTAATAAATGVFRRPERHAACPDLHRRNCVSASRRTRASGSIASGSERVRPCHGSGNPGRPARRTRGPRVRDAQRRRRAHLGHGLPGGPFARRAPGPVFAGRHGRAVDRAYPAMARNET